MIKIKMHMMPGDICKSGKIYMMEKDNSKRGKSFRDMIRSRLRAVLKERTRREIDSY